MNKNVKALFSDTVVLGLGTFLSKLLVLLLMPLYTSYLSPEMYSTADLITQTANLLMPFAMLGIVDAVFRFVFDNNRAHGTVLSTGLFILLGGMGAFALISPLLYFVPKVGGYFWLVAIYVISADIHSLFANYIRAQGRTKLFALQGIINTAATIVLNIVFLVVFEMGIIGYVLSVIVANAVVTVIILLTARPLSNVRLRSFDAKLAREMLRYCIPIIPTTIFWWITNVSDRYIVSMMCSDEINGLYAAAYKIPTLLTLATTVFNEAWQKFAFTDKRNDALKNDSASEDKVNAYYYETAFSAFSSFIFIACSGLLLLAKPMSDLLLASQYDGAWIYTPVLLAATVFTSLVTFLASVYSLKKKTMISLWTAMLGAVLNIILNITLVPKIGALGAAIATLASYMTVFFIRAQSVKKYLKFRIYSVTLFVNIAIVLIQCFAATYSGAPMYLIQGILLGAMLCFNLPNLVDIALKIFKGKN